MRLFLFAVFTMCAALFGQTDTGHYYLMSYFKNVCPPLHDMTGGFFALSTDGTDWTELNDASPIIPGSPIGEKLVRDPFLFYDAPTNTFRLVYTTGWNTKCIGYAQITVADKKDFKNFQDWDVLNAQGDRQIPINVSDCIPGAVRTWGPEIFRDDLQNKYMVHWSTATDTGGKELRGYYMLTTDFKTFTNPVKFFDPGFTVIDGDLLKVADHLYYLFYKDERDAGKKIYYVTGTAPQGPWSEASSFISSPNMPGVCGPSSIRMGNEYRVYFDPYAACEINYRIIKSTDLQTWENGGTLKSSGMNFYYSHCNVLEIPKSIYDWITTGRLSVRRNVKPLSPMYRSTDRFKVSETYNLLGKRIPLLCSQPGENAVALPTGFFIGADKTMKSPNEIRIVK